MEILYLVFVVCVALAVGLFSFQFGKSVGFKRGYELGEEDGYNRRPSDGVNAWVSSPWKNCVSPLPPATPPPIPTKAKKVKPRH